MHNSADVTIIYKLFDVCEQMIVFNDSLLKTIKGELPPIIQTSPTLSAAHLEKLMETSAELKKEYGKIQYG